MASKFELDLRRFSGRIKTDHAQVVGKIGLDLATRIIERTPVDEGRAKANWQTTISRPASGTIEPIRTGERRSSARGAANAKLAIDKAVSVTARLPRFPVIYVSNNLSYINDLENGTSLQAPSGMVVLSIAEIETFYR